MFRSSAGCLCDSLAKSTMPNTPAQIGEGMTAWTSSAAVNELQEQQVRSLLEALGKAVRVENERQIDMATALSATGPTYIFLVMEALIDAGVHMGFLRHIAQELVQQMILGSVLFARDLNTPPTPAKLLTSPPLPAHPSMESSSDRVIESGVVCFHGAELRSKSVKTEAAQRRGRLRLSFALCTLRLELSRSISGYVSKPRVASTLGKYSADLINPERVAPADLWTLFDGLRIQGATALRLNLTIHAKYKTSEDHPATNAPSAVLLK